MNGLIRGIAPTILSVFLVLGTTIAFAKNECKGMSESACSASNSCTWVKGYVSKNGNKVSAYCRSKGKKTADPKEKKSKEKKTQKNKDQKAKSDSGSKKQVKKENKETKSTK